MFPKIYLGFIKLAKLLVETVIRYIMVAGTNYENRNLIVFVFLYVAGVPAGCHGDWLVPTDLWLVARHLLTGKTIM